MTERLYTNEELSEIQETASTLNFNFPPGIEVSFPGIDFLSIMKISTNHKLILTRGNLDTGFNHIHARHDFFSEIFFFKENQADAPTKFDKKIIPISDYPKIADQIYNFDNRSYKNNNQDLFEVYEGFYNSSCNLSGKYRLVLYKDTKIIHTLFPIDNKRKKKTKTKLARGRIQISYEADNVYKIAVPYFDSKRKLIYLIIIHNNPDKNETTFVIQSHHENGDYKNIYKIYETTYEKFPSKAHETITWQNRDLSIIERHFKTIDSQEKTHYH